MCQRGTGNTIFPKTHNTLVYYRIPPAATASVAASAGAAAAARCRLRRRRLRRRHDRRFRCYCCCFLVDCCLPPLLPLFLSAATVLACPRRCHRCCLPPLLSAGAIANVDATATTAPIPSAIIAATAAYFSAAVTTASMFQCFQLPLCFNVSTAAAAAASVSIAIATIVLACRSFGASGGRWQRTP